MASISMIPSALDEVLAMGEQLLQALDAHDQDTFEHLLGRRAQLIEMLEALPWPSQPDDALQARWARLQDQHGRLGAALLNRMHDLEDDLEALQHSKRAHHRYEQATAVPPRILRANLEG